MIVELRDKDPARNEAINAFEEDKLLETEGMLVRTYDIGKGERNAFFLGPDSDYCIQLGEGYDAHFTEYGNGTTQITIKKIRS